MTVFRDKRRNNRWAYEFELSKERYQGICKSTEGIHARTKAEALEAEADARRRARAEQGMARSGVRPGAYLLSQAILRHIGNQVDSSASHVDSLKRVARELIQFFGVDRAVVDLTADDIGDYREFSGKQHRRVWVGGPRKLKDGDEDNPRLWKVLPSLRSASEVDHTLDCLRSALKIAHCTRDPLTGQPMLPFPPDVPSVHVPKRTPRPMPDEELSARLSEAPSWVVDAAMLARLFGLRLTEALIVERRHLDHEYQAILFQGEENKSGHDRRKFGGEAGWALLQRLAEQARQRSQERLVTWPGPKWIKKLRKGEIPPKDVWRPLKTIRRAWKNTIERAAIEQPHRFHDVRAKYITHVALLGSATLTKELAGHASMATTERYISVTSADLRKLADRATKGLRLKLVKK